MHKLLPLKSLFGAVYWIIFWLFGLKNIDERYLLKSIIKETEPGFIEWAVHQVVTWENETIPESLHHIHGFNDRIFPVRFLQSKFQPSKFITAKGGHFVVLNNADEISQWLDNIIGS